MNLRMQESKSCALPLGDTPKLMAVYSKSPFGWGGRIRTYAMLESESNALPLGDTPSKPPGQIMWGDRRGSNP